MSQLHRLKWIDEQIRNGRYPNCSRIAHEFEISARQASRDVEYLRYSMGAPVEYSPEQGGYYYSEATYVFPATILTETEKTTLSYLAYRYERAGSEQGARLAELFKRISSADERRGSRFPESDLPVPPEAESEARSYGVLGSAARTRMKTELTYVDSRDIESVRVFHPYKVFVSRGEAYAVGYCELRRAARVFRLSRVKDIHTLSEGFTVVADFRESDYGRDGPIDYRVPYEATVRFERTEEMPLTAMFHERIGPRTFRLQFRSSAEVLGLLFSYNDDFSIISPAWLKEKAKERFSRLMDRNQ